ncbi:hypothetical protein NP233_g922 [Leucocoprinus birnbaumii]|uniref:Nephrocystin 3-like N-terminal domain-containing protein n=1 Tax=Leucocoprinus birnbaumii TaxID=56174 RepID=A0AAD5W687_9AGAR|nr:hypothetical protein NP233_g922 [Leucocoprinus birnbaumii]
MPFFPSGHGFTINGGQFTEFSGTLNFSNSPSGIGIDTLLNAADPDAIDDSLIRETAPRCHPGTREQYIQDITHWASPRALTPTASPLFWLKGPAGVGKSAVAQSSIDRLKTLSIPCAAFFFSLNGRNRPERLFPTIAYQLAMISHEYRSFIDWRIRQDKTIVQKSMASQLRSLIVEPWQELRRSGVCRVGERIPIIIDGLDECHSADAQVKIVELIASTACIQGLPLCWAFFSRPVSHLESVFGRINPTGLCHSVTLSVSRDTDQEIEQYLRAGFASILQRHNIPMLSNWPSEADMRTLVDAAGGFFIYCSSVLRYVELSSWAGPEEPLRRVLNLISERDQLRVSRKHAQSGKVSLFSDLDAFYMLLMEGVPVDLRRKVRLLLGLLCWLSPGKCWGDSFGAGTVLMSNILGWSEVEFRSISNHLSAVIRHRAVPYHLPQGVDASLPYTHAPSSSLKGLDDLILTTFGGSLVFHHKSFFDFLSDQERSGPYSVVSAEARDDMFKLALQWHNASGESSSNNEHSTLMFQLSWPAHNELFDSILKAETCDVTYELSFSLASASDARPELSQRMASYDFRKALLIQTSLRNVERRAHYWINELTTAAGLAVFHKGARIFWSNDLLKADEGDVLDLPVFIERIHRYEQAGVLTRLDHNLIRSSKLLEEYHCVAGLYRVGYDSRSIFWYWEFSPAENYYQEFQALDLVEGTQEYGREEFTSWPIGYYLRHGNRVSEDTIRTS